MNSIRIAEITDLGSIIQIYNQAKVSRFEIADSLAIDIDDKITWFNNHPQRAYPIYVYEINNKIVGWISVSPYRLDHNALRYTVEINYFVDYKFRRKKIGSKLIEYAINKCKELNYKTIFAVIFDKNEAGIKVLEKYGFMKWGHMPNIADFEGIECGHVYYGLRIK
jgi:L-amino acid N-acyltransferase YncA